ncbi:MAG: hypothetical protein ACJ8CR_33030, partial [Roseiflexaceae bacterium]
QFNPFAFTSLLIAAPLGLAAGIVALHLSNGIASVWGRFTQMMLDLAARSGCPVLSVHGGGYNPPVTIAAAERHVEVLATYWPEID